MVFYTQDYLAVQVDEQYRAWQYEESERTDDWAKVTRIERAKAKLGDVTGSITAVMFPEQGGMVCLRVYLEAFKVPFWYADIWLQTDKLLSDYVLWGINAFRSSKGTAMFDIEFRELRREAFDSIGFGVNMTEDSCTLTSMRMVSQRPFGKLGGAPFKAKGTKKRVSGATGVQTWVSTPVYEVTGQGCFNIDRLRRSMVL